ncbi:MAG: MBL fold metallo-hydrolase [Myxococcota bacterium]
MTIRLRTAMGAAATGARLERMQASPQWSPTGGRGRGGFCPPLPREEPAFWPTSKAFLLGRSAHRTPAATPPTVPRRGHDFAAPPPDGLRVTWLGHATSLVEIEGRRVLFDPVLSERASPVSWAGPKRFFAPPLVVDEIPELDAVVLSHDHYDHLDHATIVALAARPDVPFIAPLGVGAHLEHWGVPAERIVELDWWEAHERAGLQVTATPGRHFSGRALTMSDRDQTLWAGWAVRGAKRAIFFSGDTAMFPGFVDIGTKLGPFDLAMIECGAYNANWRDMHIGPEQAVVASQLVHAGCLLPVHWGTFDLAFHGWTEPIERAVVAAAAAGVSLATPRPGQSVVPSAHVPTERWWPDVPWVPAHREPVVSSGLPSELVARIEALNRGVHDDGLAPRAAVPPRDAATT